MFNKRQALKHSYNEIMGLSPQSPLFQETKGKKKGETLSFHDTTYTIAEVF